MNKVILSGRLVKDAELRVTPDGMSVVRFTLAVQRPFKNAEGGYDADFINCIAWKNTAEFIAKYFSKGSMIELSGSIRTRSWESNGEKKYATEVNVSEAGFCGERKKDENPYGDIPNFNPPDDFVDINGSDEDLPF